VAVDGPLPPVPCLVSFALAPRPRDEGLFAAGDHRAVAERQQQPA